VQLSLDITHKNIIKDLPFRENNAIEAMQTKNIIIKAAGDRYVIPPYTLNNRLFKKLIKTESIKERRLLNKVKDIILHEFILL
jgi:hypothetical protein